MRDGNRRLIAGADCRAVGLRLERATAGRPRQPTVAHAAAPL